MKFAYEVYSVGGTKKSTNFAPLTHDRETPRANDMGRRLDDPRVGV